MELPQFKLRVKPGAQTSPEWTRLLVPFSGTSGLRILQTFKHEAIVECGSVTRHQIETMLSDLITVIPYDGNPTTREELDFLD